ncbi:MAG: alpha/beta fold hydrolase [Pseudomonadota bacterium]
MAREQVEVAGQSALDAERVWRTARQFVSDWHPAIRSVWAEQGGTVRAFQVHGEDSLYRERLSRFSDTDRCLRYRLLEGVEGLEAYRASLRVTPLTDGGCRVVWRAEIDAHPDRVQAIAAGTRAVFEAGVAVLVAAPDTPALAQTAPTVPPPSTRTVVIDGSPRLAVTVNDTDSETLCLFLHGIGGQRHNWQPQLLSPLPARCAAFDLRGYGESAPGGAQSTVEDHCEDIARVHAALGGTRLVLCGMSYGAWLATSFAHRHPEALAGLVLAAGCTGLSEADTDERGRFLSARQAPLDAGQKPADFAAEVVELIAGPDASTATRRALHDSMAAISAASYRDAITCFANPPERFDFTPLNLPVLLMTGEHDRLAPPGELRGVADRIERAAAHASVRFEVVPGAGHVCNLEQPDVCTGLLRDFLGGIVSA